MLSWSSLLLSSLFSVLPTSRVRTFFYPLGNESIFDHSAYSLPLRELAMEILSQEGEGAFIVRQSTSKPGCYALSLKTPQGKIVNYLIEVDSGGLHLQVNQFETVIN